MPVPEIVLAYAGPGADLGFLTYALGLLAWIVVSFSALVLWPVRSLLRYLRGHNKLESSNTSEERSHGGETQSSAEPDRTGPGKAGVGH
jgi:hypothetical protein